MSFQPRLIWILLCLIVTATGIRGQDAESIEDKVTLLEERRMFLPRISPNGKWLAYLTYAPDGEMPSAYVRAFGAGHDSRSLAETVLEEADLSWSRTGDLVALLRQVDGRVTLEILRQDAEVQLSVTLPEVSVEGGLAWLSNDRYVAIGCEGSVLIIDADSGVVARQVQITGEELLPDMSKFSISNENKIAFAASAAGDTSRKIWIASLDSPDAIPISVTEGPSDASPLWIDDSTIVFSRAAEPSADSGFDVSHLWRIHVYSRIEDRISAGDVHDNSPSWSPDERLLVFSRLPLSSLDLSERPSEGEEAKASSFSAILGKLAGVARDVYFNIRVAYMELDE